MPRVWLAVMLTALAGCPGEDAPPACIEVDTSCAPLYTPTFDNVYAMTLEPGCGSDRASCHSASGRMGNLSFADPATAHAELLAGRVTPGDASCSELIVRTHARGTDYAMPPGSPLPAAAQCALVQWVQAGAPGPGQPLPARAGGTP